MFRKFHFNLLMMRDLIILIISISHLDINSGCTWIFEDSCYNLVTDHETFFAAQAECDLVFKGYLVSSTINFNFLYSCHLAIHVENMSRIIHLIDDKFSWIYRQVLHHKRNKTSCKHELWNIMALLSLVGGEVCDLWNLEKI